jgi:hypothetical protein
VQFELRRWFRIESSKISGMNIVWHPLGAFGSNGGHLGDWHTQIDLHIFNIQTAQLWAYTLTDNRGRFLSLTSLIPDSHQTIISCDPNPIRFQFSFPTTHIQYTISEAVGWLVDSSESVPPLIILVLEFGNFLLGLTTYILYIVSIIFELFLIVTGFSVTIRTIIVFLVRHNQF